jgi:hypothetical protein
LRQVSGSVSAQPGGFMTLLLIGAVAFFATSKK